MSLSIAWILFCCAYLLTQIFIPSFARKPAVLAVAGLVSVLPFVWFTDGRLALFFVVGAAVSFGALLLLASLRTGNTAGRAFRLASAALLRPSLILAAPIAVVAEVAGRWSGASFVVWRALVAAALVLAAGVLFFARALAVSTRSE